MNSPSERAVSKILTDVINSAIKNPKNVSQIVEGFSKDPKSAFIAMMGLKKPDDKRLSAHFIASFSDAILAAIGTATQVSAIQTLPDKALKQPKIVELVGFDPTIAALTEIAGAALGSDRTEVPQSCLAALNMLAIRNMELLEKQAALFSCLIDHASDVTLEEPIPDICSWSATEVRQAAANVRAAYRDVKQRCVSAWL